MLTRATQIAAFAVVIFAASSAFGQGKWLDAKKVANWNKAGAAIPKTKADESQFAQCAADGIRKPTSAIDKRLTARGWFLVGDAQVSGNMTMVAAANYFDGMCRYEGYNYFVFVGDKFAGTLSPKAMNARADGSLTSAEFGKKGDGIFADYSRFTKDDALCCPSRLSTLTFSIKNGVVVPGKVTTTANPTK